MYQKAGFVMPVAQSSCSRGKCGVSIGLSWVAEAWTAQESVRSGISHKSGATCLHLSYSPECKEQQGQQLQAGGGRMSQRGRSKKHALQLLVTCTKGLSRSENNPSGELPSRLLAGASVFLARKL